MFRPEDRAGWTIEDLRRQVVGRYVSIEVYGTPAEQEYYGCAWLGGSGLVETVRDTASGPSIEFDYGIGFLVSVGTFVSRCENATHDHDTLAGTRECRVGIRGARGW